MSPFPRTAAMPARRTPGRGRGAFAHVVLTDHDRLPWRFFGRLTAAVLADLGAR